MECKIQKIRLKKIFFIKIRLTDCRMESGSRSIGGGELSFGKCEGCFFSVLNGG